MEDQNIVDRNRNGQDAILEAAIDIIARNGLTGLTLRPLASRLGVSVAVISARMGAKDQLIERAVDLAAQRDQRFFERWATLVARITPEDSSARAAVTDLAFREWVTTDRQQAIVLLELVHHHAVQGAFSATLDQ